MKITQPCVIIWVSVDLGNHGIATKQQIKGWLTRSIWQLQKRPQNNSNIYQMVSLKIHLGNHEDEGGSNQIKLNLIKFASFSKLLILDYNIRECASNFGLND
ncbi:hypothetical protein ACJX0J_027129, partial [Zea mays]